MQKYDVVTIGSTLIDIFIESSELVVNKTSEGLMLCEPLGAKIDIDQFTMTSGGGASNTAVGFTRQGFKTAVISEMGKDTLSQLALADLVSENIPTAYITQEKREETGMSVILVAPDGRRTVMVHRAATSMLEKRDVNWDLVKQSKWVHLSNISGQQPLLEELFRVVASDNDPGFSWNPGKADIALMSGYKLEVPKNTIDILFANKQEWDLLKPVQIALKDRVKLIVITDGSRGGRVIENAEGVYDFAAAKVKAVEEAGAGDAFAVGFVSNYLRGLSVENCCALGIKNAASVVQYVGAKKGLLKKS